MQSDPQPPGFTGVDWYSRPTERLAAELTGGAGAGPLSTAAQETARLASAYGAAAVALDKLLVKLDASLDAGGVTDARARSGTEAAAAAADKQRRRTGPLPEYARWLARHAADLAEYAAKLAGQAAAYETAARAMPSVADAERMRTDRETAQAAAAAGGADPAVAALAGAAADSERVEQQAHGTAAAVMVGFEKAAVPLSKAWRFTDAPKLKTADKAREKGKSKAGSGTGGAGGGGVGVPPTPLGGYAATTPHREQGGTATRPVAASSTGNTGRGFPMMPAGMLGAGAAAGAATRSSVHPSGAVPSHSDDDLPEAFVVHTAPGVLGDQGDEMVEEAL
ncbi:PPE protein OS=Tsukamurella paurometabola (strain ATCC 8368 / DSM / CCUG 35730 / CIP 100753/ JCM 10117 / KCTC 9821 / NBRC 16120 / NCIMB 702349 / NCTC 13040)OX=521096 GN=Tpau_3372 PE=3 SV=1 [Tsukamurella paurometabola]|uniref:PPE protein n=1 Tax=Tsukamurella paurometabola (strain ATCC 8368 / DSM 20162 / CCUG 35730 / CIP 100753 / JCM 10117 / KCTC 9821 / NBRC 16120 / NCIMB 702349 / NCTC 13040) TaxID=521096 RepID=D5UWF7_TSUPD|nr:PPE domain-containing protein [Tsukamurella paurometabola]ADG79956.1 PPE protein [Tsukamurella paurometabola DSM 20162]SUP37804.1 PPE-repeat proteins [Tsukamurella paurometabola]